ncbi:MAG: hypothetical protein E5X67_33825 [Mesorhizobium sp.]|uniref:hypothetical protein n=1 Tax=Mesorhizobium sp. TaxID=1871066 RepID=UPI0011FD1308|nr:hypothetical protein [Mesorhizobium sp.]TIP23319.1 MAG: hypothetical protein E5X67_33825 [Mesorhizobium sp.]
MRFGATHIARRAVAQPRWRGTGAQIHLASFLRHSLAMAPLQSEVESSDHTAVAGAFGEDWTKAGVSGKHAARLKPNDAALQLLGLF